MTPSAFPSGQVTSSPLPVTVWNESNSVFGSNSSWDNEDAVGDGDGDGKRGLRLGGLGLCLLAAATAFGNILLCTAVIRERRLQNMTNYFLTSLAVADLLIAVVVMPIGIANIVFGKYIQYYCRSTKLQFLEW